MTNSPGKETEKPLALPVRAFYPIPEARVLLGNVSNATIYRWAKQGKIRLVKVGGRRFMPASEPARINETAA